MIRSTTWILLLSCLLVPALGVPIDGATAPGARFVLHVDGRLLTGAVGDPLRSTYNPKEISVDKKTPWQSGRGSEGDAPTQEFTAGEPYLMRLGLVFDSFENGGSVRDVGDMFDRLVQPRPIPDPPTPVTWGRTAWTSRLRSASTRFTRWDRNGTPTRAEVTTLWSTFNLVGNDPTIPFAVEIPGLPATSARLREVSIAPLTIDPARRPPDRHRIFFEAPRGRQATASLTFAENPSVNAELQAWFSAARRGTEVPRNLTVTLFGAGNVAARTYALTGCALAGHRTDDPQAPVPHVTLDLACERMLLQDVSSGRTTGIVGEEPGFMVSIAGARGAGTAFFTSVRGLGLDADAGDFDEGGVHGRPLVLAGTPIAPRQAFVQWVNDAANGDPWKAALTITELLSSNGELQPGRTWQVPNAAPRGFVFGRLSALDSNGDVLEAIRVDR